jgi:hypothetical protein
MGVVTSGLRRASSTLSWLSAHLPKPPQLYTDRFADPHEVDPLVSPNWQQEAGLLVGVSSFNHVLSVRQAKKRGELGNVLVDALTRGGKGLLHAGFEKYRLLPYAGQLMNLPINQVAAHLQAVSSELATKFLSGNYQAEKDYDEKKFLTSSWETATSRLYPILSDELLRCFDGSDFTASAIITSPTPITVYLRLPEAELSALAPVVRLIFQTLIHDMQTTYDKRPGRTAKEKGCYPVLLLLDSLGICIFQLS